MPRRKKFVRRRFRRGIRRFSRFNTRRRRFARRAKRVTSSRQGNGVVVKDKSFVKLRYSETFHINTSGSSAGFTVMRGNSIFDPNYTSTGTQPYGHDQWANFYYNYLVYGSKISVKYTPTNASASSLDPYSHEILVFPTYEYNSTPFGSDIDFIRQQPYVKSRQVQAGSSNLPARLSAYHSTGKIFGLTNKEVAYRDSEFGASFGYNPALQWFWQIYVREISGTVTDTITGQLTITVDYYTRMRSRKTLPQS